MSFSLVIRCCGHRQPPGSGKTALYRRGSCYDGRKVDDHAQQAFLCLPQCAAGERLGPVVDFIETAG
ncbi:hypothetical protein [Bosea sp. FBZP-16]|uniref:hypothetical protein n=1 Tax=Bosea sp. FBZP-16 TaxID=2065382 RepID=UPI00131A0F30|nr:hypothetical protein [Bosea sp. FBZP-16]